MYVNHHANATTLRTRVYIQQSTSSINELANKLGISHVTVRRWKARLQVHDLELYYFWDGVF